MAFCVYYSFKILAVDTVLAMVLDESIAARDPPVLYAYERGAGTARRPKPNAVITFSQVGPFHFEATLAEISSATFNA
jgi:hypothetical protein